MARVLGIVMTAALLAAACTGSDPQTTVTDSSTSEVIPTEPPPVIDETPTAPTGLVVIDTSEGEIRLAWDPSRSETVTGYEVTRVGGGITERFTADDAEFIDAGLVDGDIYTYSVAAIGEGGRSPRSEAVTARVGVDDNPPSVPGRPQPIDSAEESVALEWRASTDIAGVDKYIVTRTIGDESVEIETETPELLDDDVEPGIIVTYAVAAVDGNGNTSEQGRSITVLSGSASDDVVIVVSAQADPDADPQTSRLRRDLLDAGFVVSWFEDGAFDANLTDSGDIVLLVGDVEGEGFDWNIFATDSHIIGLKSGFVQAGGITDNPPKLDRLAQLNYQPPGKDVRRVEITTTGRPKPAVYIPPNEQLPDLEVWARPTWSDEIAVAGIIPEGGELASEKPAPGCRAFFPGNAGSLAEQTEDGWELLIEFVGDVSAACR